MSDDLTKAVELCRHDGKPCYVGKGRDAHWRCGTVHCQPQRPAEGEAKWAETIIGRYRKSFDQTPDYCGFPEDLLDAGETLAAAYRASQERHYQIMLVIAGGEDAPGYAATLGIDDVRRFMKEDRERHEYDISEMKAQLAASAEREAKMGEEAFRAGYEAALAHTEASCSRVYLGTVEGAWSEYSATLARGDANG